MTTGTQAYGQIAVYRSADTEDCHLDAVLAFSRYGYHVDLWAVSEDGAELHIGRRTFQFREPAEAYAQFCVRFD